MSISIFPQIYPLVPKEDVIVLGVGSTRKMEEVLRCTSWVIDVMLPALRSIGHYLNVSRPSWI